MPIEGYFGDYGGSSSSSDYRDDTDTIEEEEKEMPSKNQISMLKEQFGEMSEFHDYREKVIKQAEEVLDMLSNIYDVEVTGSFDSSVGQKSFKPGSLSAFNIYLIHEKIIFKEGSGHNNHYLPVTQAALSSLYGYLELNRQAFQYEKDMYGDGFEMTETGIFSRIYGSGCVAEISFPFKEAIEKDVINKFAALYIKNYDRALEAEWDGVDKPEKYDEIRRALKL